MDTNLTIEVNVSLQRDEPNLPRKALLATLEDRIVLEELVSLRPYTYVKIRSHYNKKEYIGIGFSKVCYPDTWNHKEGVDIAKRHALINILHQVRADEEMLKKYRPYEALPLSA